MRNVCIAIDTNEGINMSSVMVERQEFITRRRRKKKRSAMYRIREEVKIIYQRIHEETNIMYERRIVHI